jgi:branched-chain amino acid transport system ATP-binding protein
MTTDEIVLSVRDLEVFYQGSIKALHGVSLDLRRGQVAAILGTNGAGKTTTLRAISGFIGLDNARIRRGGITFKGEDLAGKAPYEIMRRGIVLVPERDKVFPNLTVLENLEAVTSTGRAAMSRTQLTDLVFEYFPRLASHRRRIAGLLSGGERQMLAVGAAIVCGPELLLVDELSLGLAPLIVDDLARRLLRLRNELDLSILLVEQSASVALRLASYGFVLETGRVALEGEADSLRRSDMVQQLYLGTSDKERGAYRAAVQRRMEAELGRS